MEDVDFNQSYWRRTVAERVRESFNTFILSNSEDGFRSHLGWSVIGNECERYLYYHFRWFKQEKHSARMLELFALGHEEEKKIRQLMRNCGAQFLDKVDETGEQLRVSDLGGHFGGSCDGVFIWPAIGITLPTLLECKTQKDGSDFRKLYTHELVVANQHHYAQASGYGQGFNINFALYVCRNKNNSELYIEIVDLDFKNAERHREKAFKIINATEPPKRISNKKNFYKCNMCSMQELCQGDEKPVPNCRNCKNAEPVENGQWNCKHYEQIIPKDYLIKGCSEHQFLNY